MATHKTIPKLRVGAAKAAAAPRSLPPTIDGHSARKIAHDLIGAVEVLYQLVRQENCETSGIQYIIGRLDGLSVRLAELGNGGAA